MKKRILGLLLVLAIVICAIETIAFAQEQHGSKDMQDDGFHTEEEVFAAWGPFTEMDAANYSGMYIDDNNNLVLLFVEGTDALMHAQDTANRLSYVLTSKDGSQKQILLIQGAEYSYKTLTTVMDSLTKKAYSNKAVKNISLDVKNNRIDVGINGTCNKENIAENLYKTIVSTCGTEIDPDILSIHVDDEEIRLLTGVTVNGNSRINKKTSTAITYITVGVGYYRYSTGQRGFITCGHGLSKNDIIYSENTQIGTVKKRVYNGTCDASFVLFDNEDSYVSNTTLYEELSWDVPIVGGTVTQRGAYSGTVSGQVISTNYSYIGNGHAWTNLITTNHTMQNGDSGGGMKCGVTDGGRTSKIVGFLHGSSTTLSAYIKGSVVSNALN